MSGRTIRIYLVDGVPTGPLTSEIINWTGKVLVFPRSQFDQMADRPEARRTGVYLLVGPDPGGRLADAGPDGLLVFTEDVPFSSPSAAAEVVYGGNQNGRVVWRV